MQSYAPESLKTTIPKREDIYAAVQDGSILEAPAIRCDAQHNLMIHLDGLIGIMPREECALGIDTGQTREIAILSRVGKPVCFQVQRIEGNIAYLSRRAAQQEALHALLTERSSRRYHPSACDTFGAIRRICRRWLWHRFAHWH